MFIICVILFVPLLLAYLIKHNDWPLSPGYIRRGFTVRSYACLGGFYLDFRATLYAKKNLTKTYLFSKFSLHLFVFDGWPFAIACSPPWQTKTSIDCILSFSSNTSYLSFASFVGDCDSASFTSFVNSPNTKPNMTVKFVRACTRYMMFFACLMGF